VQWRRASWNFFEGYVPGGNWVTVGYRFAPGPSSEVHLGRLEWKGKIMEKSSKTMEKQWKNRVKPSENLVNQGKME